jgi:RNA polymerase subunit RPABC4/transcription elongation factor Spt4
MERPWKELKCKCGATVNEHERMCPKCKKDYLRDKYGGR